MAYSTVAQIREESPFKNAVNIPDTYIEEVIDDMDSLIDTYIGKVYVLPLTSPAPFVIRALSKDLTVCSLFRDQNPDIEIATGVTVEDWWNTLMKQLEKISKKEIVLVGDDGVELPQNGNYSPRFYPTEASSRCGGETAPKFKMNQKF